MVLGYVRKFDETLKVAIAEVEAFAVGEPGTPGYRNILDTCGWILFKRKEYREALAVLEKAHS